MQAVLSWETLRWRNVEWERIPPDSRELVVTFLSVLDNVQGLNRAVTNKKDELRKHLKTSYKGAVIPAFHTYPFTDENNFEGLRWVIKAEVKLQSITLTLQSGAGGKGEVTKKNDVLWHLVERGIPDIAELYATKSAARDTSNYYATFEEPVTTLWLAAYKGYAPVVRALISKGDDMNKPGKSNGSTPLYVASYDGRVDVVRVLVEHGADINKATNDGATPLYVASQEGHVDVVRVLVEQGADINKAQNEGATPLFQASEHGCVDVVRVLVEQGADITKTWDNKTPLQIARQENHPEIIHLLELAAQA